MIEVYTELEIEILDSILAVSFELGLSMDETVESINNVLEIKWKH